MRNENFELRNWIQCISSHMYLGVAKSANVDAEMIVVTWQPVKNHAENQHNGHGTFLPASLLDEHQKGPTQRNELQSSVILELLIYFVRLHSRPRGLKSQELGNTTNPLQVANYLPMDSYCFLPQSLAVPIHIRKAR